MDPAILGKGLQQPHSNSGAAALFGVLTALENGTKDPLNMIPYSLPISPTLMNSNLPCGELYM